MCIVGRKAWQFNRILWFKSHTASSWCRVHKEDKLKERWKEIVFEIRVIWFSYTFFFIYLFYIQSVYSWVQSHTFNVTNGNTPIGVYASCILYDASLSKRVTHLIANHSLILLNWAYLNYQWFIAKLGKSCIE